MTDTSGSEVREAMLQAAEALREFTARQDWYYSKKPSPPGVCELLCALDDFAEILTRRASKIETAA